LLRISPYQATGLRLVSSFFGGLSGNRRCDLIRTKAAAYGGWGRLPPHPLPTAGWAAILLPIGR
ncbi:MAG: hypothetical protein LUC87_09275, partial [Clostridiales bacterium]|nr:hypothetical protein [Clostridiales bacterium]